MFAFMLGRIPAIERYLSRVAGTTALFLALAPPCTFFALQYQALNGNLEAAANAKAAIVDSYIGRNPGSWQFQHERLQELLRVVVLPHTNVTLLDSGGTKITEVLNHDSDYSLKRTAPIHDFGLQVGWIEVADDLHPLLLSALQLLVVSSLIALAVFWVLRHFPVRALREADRLRLGELERRLETETQLRNLQERITLSQRLEAVGRLAAGVAHEVKNPLATIQFGIDVLRNTHPSPAARMQVLHTIEEAVTRADRITHNLLELSSQREPVMFVTDLNDIARKASELTYPAAKDKGIDLRLQLAAAALPVEVDREQLLQVLVNLITNAIQATENGGDVSIETYSARLQAENLAADVAGGLEVGNTAAVLVVKDSGHGLGVEPNGKLFEPFYTTKSVGEGTGLGLSIVRNIIALHRGSVTLRNRDGGGAEATVMLNLKGDIQ